MAAPMLMDPPQAAFNSEIGLACFASRAQRAHRSYPFSRGGFGRERRERRGGAGEFISIYGKTALGPAGESECRSIPTAELPARWEARRFRSAVFSRRFLCGGNKINVLVPYESPGARRCICDLDRRGSSQILPLQVAAAQPNIMAVLNPMAASTHRQPRAQRATR